MAKQILQLTRQEARDELREPPRPAQAISQADLFAARREVLDIHMADNLEEYLLGPPYLGMNWLF